MALLLDEFNGLSPSLSRRDRTLVWLDKIVSELAAEIRGDVTRKLATRVERRQCFVTLNDGTIQKLEQWVDETILEESESEDAVPRLSMQAFGHFCLKLSVLKHDLNEKTVEVELREEREGREERIKTVQKVVEVGPVMRCAAAYARQDHNRGRRAHKERVIPDKWVAFRDLAAHLGIVARNMEPDVLKRALLKAKARLT